MKDDQLSNWESQWMSQKQSEKLATQRMELEQTRHANGWRRNYLGFAAMVILVLIAVASHFA